MFGSSFTKRLVLTLIVWVSVCLSATAQTYRSPGLWQRENYRAYQKLLHAHVFNFGGVGFGQQITEEEKAFTVIFESRDADRLFQLLSREANAEGKLYALFGLRAKNAASFERAAQRIRDEETAQRQEEVTLIPKGKVRVARGCISYQVDVQTVVDEIAKGRWDDDFHLRRPLVIN